MQLKLQKFLTAVICAISLFAFCNPSFAQTDVKKKETEQEAESEEPAEAASAPRIKTLPPAYGAQLNRLAEVLGALHYLRKLCGANEGQLWREQMNEIINKEDPTSERRAVLISSFNRGFRSFREIHRECSKTAVEAGNLYLTRGLKLSAEIPDRYGR